MVQSLQIILPTLEKERSSNCFSESKERKGKKQEKNNLLLFCAADGDFATLSDCHIIFSIYFCCFCRHVQKKNGADKKRENNFFHLFFFFFPPPVTNHFTREVGCRCCRQWSYHPLPALRDKDLLHLGSLGMKPAVSPTKKFWGLCPSCSGLPW